MTLWRLLLVCALAAGCGLSLGREYEYEEQMYLGVNGAATVVINASVPALVVLRGLPLDPAPRARFEPLALRQLYEAAGCTVERVGAPWYRHGRRFVQIRVASPDVETLGECGPLGWSTYRFDATEDAIEFEQHVAGSAGGEAPGVTWTGNELVAFRIHVPSKVLYHNVRRLKDDAPGEIERGNILTWQQRLADRRAGQPLTLKVTMAPQSILHRTLWLFAGSFFAAVAVLAGLIAWTIRKGKARMRRA